ncbi:hypothetical protein G7Z17_g7559 [Cylindrodendrum hubeiense]|uniref:Uncharacterized protein n=1 Tax=Cylindrodendrum hubeiense TaxID=595255 RepID=A0A9P5HB75_9HYPO|nr:hypothetical protein G7Z17_g7559 [Cylindrodendrum hubeiense]
MLQGRLLQRGPRLPCLSPSPPFVALPLQLPILDPPIRHRPAVGQRRWFAFHATVDESSTSNSLSTSHLLPRFPDSTLFEDASKQLDDLAPLDRLLRAIQCGDVPRIVPAFLLWVELLKHHGTRVADAAHDELRELPAATFSEIMRCIDPVANPAHDASHGLNITQGQMQFLGASSLIDDFGVRIHHCKVLDAVKVLMDARRAVGVPMLIPDYEVSMRCAGAAVDIHAAIDFFAAISKDGLGPQRNTSTWTEFTKAMFITEPMYYQFDRSRVVVLPRQMYSARQPMEPKGLWALERLRYSLGNLRSLPFNRNKRHINQDLRMITRQKMRSRSHWISAKLYGVLLNEELLCASMISFARSSSLALIKGNVLRRGFRISLKEDQDTGESILKGGKRFRKGNPREPTERLLHAIVEAFGSMSRIRAALELLVYVSRLHRIPIPHETWSNLLNWAYVCGSKPFQVMRRHQGSYQVHVVKAKDVTEIWHVMTSEPFNVKPTFDDYSVYIKSLIVQRSFRTAIDIIRNEAVPYYRRLEEEHHKILIDELLQNTPGPTHQRIQVETHKQYVWFHIANCFKALVKTASANRVQREGHFMQVILPDLINEFGEFFHHQVTYRSAQSHICLTRPMVERRFNFEMKVRRTLPEKLGGMVVQSLHKRGELDTEDPEFEWPQVPQLNVLDWKRRPEKRTRVVGPASLGNDPSPKEWWRAVSKELRT